VRARCRVRFLRSRVGMGAPTALPLDSHAREIIFFLFILFFVSSSLLLRRMHDVQQDTTTVLQMSEVTYNVDLPDALFDPQQLRTTVVSPLWQPYRAQARRHVSEVQATPNANSAPGAARGK
jgi:hypothetical protein